MAPERIGESGVFRLAAHPPIGCGQILPPEVQPFVDLHRGSVDLLGIQTSDAIEDGSDLDVHLVVVLVDVSRFRDAGPLARQGDEDPTQTAFARLR